jgi:tetratricopeptide (TPR) repeat protein
MHPDNALSCFLRANLMMIIEQPDQAEPLYRQALLDETESPSALFGYALALQQNGKFEDAARRYNDFLDIHENSLAQDGKIDLVDFAYDFLQLTEAGFSKPPKWKQVYVLPIMNDLGL